MARVHWDGTSLKQASIIKDVVVISFMWKLFCFTVWNFYPQKTRYENDMIQVNLSFIINNSQQLRAASHAKHLGPFLMRNTTNSVETRRHNYTESEMSCICLSTTSFNQSHYTGKYREICI